MAYHKFVAYLDDGNDVVKVGIPAKSERAAREMCEGNGEIIGIKDVTEDFPIDLCKVEDALDSAGFGKMEKQFILRTLDQTGIAVFPTY